MKVKLILNLRNSFSLRTTASIFKRKSPFNTYHPIASVVVDTACII